MGVFTIYPRRQSTITCSLMEDGTTDYQVVPSSIDMNEGTREEVVYAPAEYGGSVRKVRNTLVPIRFRVVIFGSTQANAMANSRTFRHAIMNPDGGYIAYRPLGLGTSILQTYYHYLRSKPPVLQRRGALNAVSMEQYAQLGRPTTDYAIVWDVEVMTKAWATSDPETLIEIVSSTSLQSRDDATYNNYVTIADTSIKGDAIFPTITVDSASVSTFDIFVHKRPMISGSTSNLDWFEGEDIINTGFTTTVDSTASDGNYAESTASSGQLRIVLSSVSIDSTYLGKIAHLFRASCSDGSTEYRVTFSISGAGDQTELEPVLVSGTSWAIYSVEEVDLPLYSLPNYYTDDTTKTVGDFVRDNLQIIIDFSRVSGSGDVYVDWVAMAKVDNSAWIGKFVSYWGYDSTNRLVVDSTTPCQYVAANVDENATDVVYRIGPPLEGLLLKSGWDYRLRFIVSASANCSFNATVEGVYATIYPFEES